VSYYKTIIIAEKSMVGSLQEIQAKAIVSKHFSQAYPECCI